MTDQESEESLVSYVNGTATKEQAERAQETIRREPAAAAEYQFLMAVRSAMQTRPDDQQSDFGIERFRRRLESHQNERRQLQLWRGLTALAASLVVLLGAFHFVTEKQHQAEEQIRLLGGRGTGTIQVRFQPAATSVELQHLFRDLDLEITSGPSALGVYHLKLSKEDSDQTRARALAHLHERKKLVEFAELDR